MTYEEEIKKRYTGVQGIEYHKTKRLIPDKAYDWIAKLRAEKISPYIKENDIVLEYGVGSGWNLAGLKCKNKIGYDLSDHLEQAVSSHGIEFINNINEVADFSVNIVVCHHALEHMANPTKFFTDSRRILCDNGKIILFAPFEKERRYRHYNPDEPNHHLYSWNVQTLGNFVSSMGFKIEHEQKKPCIQQFGYDRFSSVCAVKLHMGESGFRLIRRTIHIIKPAYEICIVAKKDK